jgi:hypothetical protein
VGACPTTFHRLLRVLILGPFLGLDCGLVLSVSGMGLPTWAGSLALDLTVRGTLGSLELAATLCTVNWIDRPDPPHCYRRS